MKFARYLEENVVVEWRKAYINYRGLKKVIKRVDARRQARLSRDLSRFSSKTSSKKSFASTLEGIRKRTAVKGVDHEEEGDGDEANDTSFFSVNRKRRYYAGTSKGTGLTDDEEEEDHLPPVTLDGTGLALASFDNNWRRREGGGAGSDTTKISFADDRKQNTLHTKYDFDVEANALPNPESRSGSDFTQNSDVRTRPNVEEHHGNDGGNHKRKKGKKEKKTIDKEVNYETVVEENFDKEERKFFAALDNELERIVAFYVAREADMGKRYEMLARQLRELSDHRKEYKASHVPLEGRFSHLVHPISQPAQAYRNSMTGTRSSRDTPQTQITDKKSENDGKIKSDAPVDEGDKRRSIALSKLLNSGGGTLTEAEDEEVRRLNKDAAMSHDPERYRAARKKLKAVVLEYYRGLEILKNYKILNRTGFAKILKKLEKTTEVHHCADAYYKARVTPSVLVTSQSCEKLMKSTEEIFASFFEHGDRKKALQRLRVNAAGISDNSSTHHISVARAGFYLGVTLCALIGGITNALHPETKEQIPNWQSLLRVYGAELLPTLFALLFGLNLAVWHRARVNSIFIFEWDVRHALDYHQYFELPTFFLLLLSLAFWVSFLNPFPQTIAPTTWPLVWLVAVLVILLDPLPFTHYYSRRWIVTSLARVLQGGLLYTVEFRDFFLGDKLNSINWSISMLWFMGCEYNTKWAYPDRCDPNQTFWTPILLALPAFLRWIQCFRRYKDSKYTANLHLINAGKYTSSIFYYFFYFNYRYHGSERTKDLALWCVFGSIYSIYTSAWDITMDWSLLRRNARYPYLRNELVYETYWPFYYWAIITNIIGRFAWIIYLLPGPASSLMRIFIIALLEMLRRHQWNYLRLENEHLGNVDMYRVSREVPLPYHLKTDRSKEDEETEDDEARKPASGPKALLRLKSAVMQKYNVKHSSHTGVTLNREEADRQHSYPSKGEWGEEEGEEEEEEEAVSEGSVKAILPQTNGSKGKQRVSSASSEAGDEEGKPKTLSRILRNHLVPDRGGFSSNGSRLDEVGGTKGASARDYEPRPHEAEGTRDSGIDTSEDEQHDVELKQAHKKTS